MIDNLENERWIPLINYDGIYEISSKGRVKSLNRIITDFNGKVIRKVSEKIKGQNINGKGYCRIQLSKNGINSEFMVHRLVLESFGFCRKEKQECNHINGIPSDNRIENLEWCTHSENIQHSIKYLDRKKPVTAFKKGQEHIFYGLGHLKQQCKKIKCDTLGLSFNSIKEAGRILGVNNGNLCQHLKGSHPHIEGLTFRYI